MMSSSDWPVSPGAELISDGDSPPFEPRGCPAQAWDVAEVLRVWRALGGD